MLTKPLSKKSYVICQLIGGYTERDVVKICSRIKSPAFQEVIEKIKQTIF